MLIPSYDCVASNLESFVKVSKTQANAAVVGNRGEPPSISWTAAWNETQTKSPEKRQRNVMAICLSVDSRSTLFYCLSNHLCMLFVLQQKFHSRKKIIFFINFN